MSKLCYIFAWNAVFVWFYAFSFLGVFGEANEDEGYLRAQHIDLLSPEFADVPGVHYGKVIMEPRGAPKYPRAVSGPTSCVSCSSFSVNSSMSMSMASCNSTFCYTITNTDPNSIVTEVDFLGISYKVYDFSSNVTGWSHYTNSLSWVGTVFPQSSVQVCFTLAGNYVPGKGHALLTMGGSSCAFSVSVPVSSVPCGGQCVIDYNIEDGTCPPCLGQCTGGYYATTTRTCTLTTLVPGAPGLPCNTLTTQTCSTPCRVDCSMTGPLYPPCPADCNTPTATITGGYSTVSTPNNGGATCPSVTPGTTVCTLPYSVLLAQCGVDCVVNGVPNDPCPIACASNSFKPTTTVMTYPTTLRTPFGNGMTCPTLTTSCNCVDCVLDAAPTYVQQCNAYCTAYDGSNAYGSKVMLYSVKTPASGGGTCVSWKTAQCSTTCPCAYNSAYVDPVCTTTTTISSVVPWVASGFQKAYLYGSAAACNLQTTTPCWSTITPVDCQTYANCPQLTCTRTTGPDYWTASTYACPMQIIQTNLYGGTPCNTQPLTTVSSAFCPGCAYQAPWCSCSFTATSSRNAQSTTYYGNPVCTSMPSNYLGQGFAGGNSITPAFTCPIVTSTNTNSACTSTVSNNACIYQNYQCAGCVYTSMSTNALPWWTVGAQLCTLTAMGGVPATMCPTMSSVTPCSSKLLPVDCTVSTMCPVPTATCPPNFSGSTSAATPCTRITFQSAQYGGQSCTNLGPLPTMTATTTCSPTVQPTCEVQTGCNFNGVVFNNASIYGQAIGGSLAVGGNAVLAGVNLGQSQHYPLPSCGGPCSGLFVGGNLVFSGYIYGGDGYVMGSCTSGSYSRCNLKCGLINSPCDQCSAPITPTSLINVKKCITALSARLLLPIASSTLFTVRRGVLGVQWGGSSVEVMTYNSNVTNPMPVFYVFGGVLAPSATIIVNVRGTYVRIMNNDFDALSLVGQYVIFNFPDATTVEITGTTIYMGMFIAPNANIIGDGIIVGGTLYASNITGVSLKTINLEWVGPYLGASF